MLRIEVRHIKPGMSLALPVQNPHVPSRTLLNVGYVFEEEMIGRLQTEGIRSVWVRYPRLSFLEELVSHNSIKNQHRVVGQISDSFEQMQQQSSAKLPYGEYTQSLGEMIETVMCNPKSAVFLGDMTDAADDMLRRASAVTYLCILMGLKLDAYIIRQRPHVNPARAKDVVNLGLGAMLADIGVTQLPEEVRERHRETGDESDPAWREHPTLGYRMLRGNVGPSAATVVLNHHQRSDGSGYVGGEFPVLRGSQIHIFARIAAVADEFNRLRNPPSLPEQPAVWALSSMIREPLVSKFDRHVLGALIEVVPPYPPGSIVRLSDGRYAVCVDHNPIDPCRPVVQIIPEPGTIDDSADGESGGPMIDLSQQTRRLYVAESEGHGVGEMNFDMPRFHQSLSAA